MTAVHGGTWVHITTLDDLWEGELLPVTVDGVEVIVLNVGGEVVAFEDRCPHVANPLSSGSFDGELLVCAAHQWTFTAVDGQGVNPSIACLRRFAVQVIDEAVAVNVHDVVQEPRGMQ
jgi:toluene monooxygenase system ferredoxin subunit